MQVMKSMPRVEETRKRKAEGGPSYGKKSKTDPLVLSASHYYYPRPSPTMSVGVGRIFESVCLSAA